MYYVNLPLIVPNPYQTRASLDQEYVESLARDIYSRCESRPATHGLLQIPVGRVVDSIKHTPLDVTPLPPAGGSLYDWLNKVHAHIQLAYGHNRYAAFKLLKAEDHKEYVTMPVELVNFTDEEMAVSAWSENAARKDLTSIEEATAIKRMMEGFSWNQAQVAEKLGLQRSTIANKLRLLRLPEDCQELVQTGRLSERQAMAALPVLTLPAETLEAAKERGYRYFYNEFVRSVENSAPSNTIRAAADWVVKCATKLLSDVPHSLTNPHPSSLNVASSSADTPVSSSIASGDIPFASIASAISLRSSSRPSCSWLSITAS